ncbi:hypothetical protein HUG17_0691 [Dermatophagoides farinae]|nr:hypothetical protein HUG17_0691 [Dermatophagoides farinae]
MNSTTNAASRSRSVGAVSSPDSRHNRHSMLNDSTITYCDLARTVNVNLPYEITKNVLTLIRLGVPPDDIYVFLRECLTYSRFAHNINAQPQPQQQQ